MRLGVSFVAPPWSIGQPNLLAEDRFPSFFLFFLISTFSSSKHLSWLRSNRIAIFPTAVWDRMTHVFPTQRFRVVVLEPGVVWQTDCAMIRNSVWPEEHVQIQRGNQLIVLNIAYIVRTIQPSFSEL